MRRRAPAVAGLLLVLAGTACGRGGERSYVEESLQPGPPPRTDFPEQFRAGERVLTRDQIARGASLYHGYDGEANCMLCHGPYLAGGSRGTNLRDGQWHHGDGSYDFLVDVTVRGTDRSVRSPIGRMPPTGGVPLTRGEVEALAAYIYWFANTQPESTETRFPEDASPTEQVTEGEMMDAPPPADPQTPAGNPS